jgi:nicotinate-nucleotide adenylyltransferase
VQLATENDARLKVSDVEFKLSKPSYSIDTLTYLQEKHPLHEFIIIMGGDSFQNIHRWKNYQLLLKNYSFILDPRSGFEVNDVPANVQIVQAPLLEISATAIRNNIKEGKSVRYLIPDKVRDEIERAGYYK